MPALVDLDVRNAKGEEKPYKLLALAICDVVSLKLARQRRGDARRLVVQGIDPGVQRKVEKLSQ